MPKSPEQEPIQDVSDIVQERQEELPPEVEKIETGVQRTQVQPSAAPPTDDSGAPLVQSPATKSVTITIPADEEQLDDWAKGSPEDALTWFANFWKRIIKKALHFGWKIVRRGRE